MQKESSCESRHLSLLEGDLYFHCWICRAKLENVVVVGSNKCVWVQLDSECCEFVSPKDQDPGSYNGE